MSSAEEAELGALFMNAKTAVPMRKTLKELGHQQPQTLIQTDNKTVDGLINNKIVAKVTKSIDMKFHRLWWRGGQEQFLYLWRPGQNNIGDCWTKHHPGAHHKAFCPTIITSRKFIDVMHTSIK